MIATHNLTVRRSAGTRAGISLEGGRAMAERKAKTAESRGSGGKKVACPDCGSDARIVQYAGYGPRGFFWVCEKECGFMRRTR